jgi:hypothetical protein
MPEELKGIEFCLRIRQALNTKWYVQVNYGASYDWYDVETPDLEGGWDTHGYTDPNFALAHMSQVRSFLYEQSRGFAAC